MARIGSTTTGNISSRVTKNVRFEGQHIWRYHPKTEVFEIFAEGGGNTFSSEIDAQGRVFSGTNGGQRGMHYDQGMSGTKNFGKHGPPANPYAFGYFDHMVTKSDGKRFSQAFCIYDGDLMAKELGGRIIAPNSLQNMVYVSRRVPETSTFRAEDEAPLLKSSDRWFRPVDAKVGPDGAIYLADWYDTRLSHVRPVDDWSKEDGRIYRVRPAGATLKHEPFDLHTATPLLLLKYLEHPNRWFRRQAALELGWRGERSVLPQLEKLARDSNNPHALRCRERDRHAGRVARRTRDRVAASLRSLCATLDRPLRGRRSRRERRTGGRQSRNWRRVKRIPRFVPRFWPRQAPARRTRRCRLRA